MLQIEALSVSPFILGFLYVFTEIRVKRAPFRLSEMSGREFCRDDGMAITGGSLM